MIKSTLSLIFILSLSSCLRTRAQIDGRAGVTPAGPVVQAPASGPVVTASNNAPKTTVAVQPGQDSIENQLANMQAQLRELVGRVEVLEKNWSMSQNSNELAELRTQMSAKMALYEQALVRLEKQSSSKSKKTVKKTSSKSVPKNAFEIAEDKFKASQWRSAVLSYQDYRTKNPRGSFYAEATYKIGVCFQELKAPGDAKAFYKEVIAKFPKSDAARRASYRLKRIK